MRTRKGDGTASWVIRRTKNGVASFETLSNRYPDLSLSAARDELRKFGNGGADGTSFAELFEEWFDHKEREWRRPEQMRGYIRRLAAEDPHLMATNIKSIDLMTVRKSLKRYAKNHGNVAANRLTNIIKQNFDHAVRIGWLKYSPISKLTTEVVGGSEKSRDRVLTDDEIRLVWNTNRHRDLFRFLLLTGQRIQETQLARLDDITRNEWFIPAENNKAGRDHRVSMSKQAKVIVERQDHDPIFGVTSPTAVQAYLKRWCAKHQIGENRKQIHQGRFTPHDLRRTMVTRMNDLGVAPHVVEKIVSHRMQGNMAIYNHAEYWDERVEAMQLWADALEKIV